MIKVLFVDDEQLALDYLSRIVNWDEQGFQVVGKALDGEQAISLYRKHKPELIVTDIKMPGITGIELASVIRENDKQSHILFLSIHKDFNYVKQAIRLGIDDYLVKSDIDEDTFLSKILALKELVEKEEQTRRYTFGKVLQDVFLRGDNEKNYRAIVDEQTYLKLFQRHLFFVLDLKRPVDFLPETLAANRSRPACDEYRIQETCRQVGTAQELKFEAFFSLDKARYLLTLRANSNMVSQYETGAVLYAFAVELRNQLAGEGMRFNIFYTETACTIRQFADYFTARQNDLRIQYLIGKPVILGFSELCQMLPKARKVPASRARELAGDIRAGDRTLERELFRHLRLTLEEKDIESFCNGLQQVFEALQEFDGVAGKTSGRILALAASSEDFDLSNPEQLLDFLQLKINEIIMLLAENNGRKYSRATQEMVKCIHGHYSDPSLTAQGIAKSAGLSYTWATVRFKEETGANLNEFLNEYRIRVAKELFDADSNIMIYEVSEKTGFTSSQYFSKVFKRYTGITPNEYKRKG